MPTILVAFQQGGKWCSQDAKLKPISMLNGSGAPHGGCGSCHWNGSFLLNGSFLPRNASFLQKRGSSRLQRHQQRHQRHLQAIRQTLGVNNFRSVSKPVLNRRNTFSWDGINVCASLLHLRSPADCGCSTRPEGQNTNGSLVAKSQYWCSKRMHKSRFHNLSRPSWGQTNQCANSSVRLGSHMEASHERRQRHAQLASSKHHSPWPTAPHKNIKKTWNNKVSKSSSWRKELGMWNRSAASKEIPTRSIAPPAHASKPCHSQHPPKVGLAPRSLCHALSSTSVSWMATMPQFLTVSAYLSLSTSKAFDAQRLAVVRFRNMDLILI